MTRIEIGNQMKINSNKIYKLTTAEISSYAKESLLNLRAENQALATMWGFAK